MITLASWNINSVRARLDLLKNWLQQNQPDFLLLQEIKCVADQFPAEELKSLGYVSHIVGQASYNGVAILAKKDVEVISTALPGDPADIQARYLEIITDNMHVINIYAPNGNPLGTDKFTYKLAWLQRLHNRARELLAERKHFVIGGDFNIIPETLDAAHPENWLHDALYQPESRAAWRGLSYLGLTDAYRALHRRTQEFTFWDYQAGSWPRNDGIRIDHFLLSPKLADRLEKCWIDKTPRALEKPSDHTPILITLKP